MVKAIIIRTVLTWFAFLPIAIINGVIREKTYKPVVGDLAAHQISTVLAVLAFFALTYLIWKNQISTLNLYHLLVVGSLLVIMTMIFEFVFGHYLFGNSWERLLGDYNLLKGRVWGLFLLSEFLTPFIIKLITKL